MKRPPVSVPLARSHTLRLAITHSVVFGATIAVLLGFIYWATAGFMSQQADETIAAEIAGLAEQYRRRGLDGLTQLIGERIRRDPRAESVYLFATGDYRALAGNLTGWPDVAPDEEGWLNFRHGGEDGARRTRARAFVLDSGLRLLVGREVQALDEFSHRMRNAMGWGFLAAVALAALVGVVTSRATVRRIESINATCREIMAGDLSQRVPSDASGDDFDQLTDNLNAMLDEIETLMASVRDVSDSVAHDLRTPLTRLKHRLEELAGTVVPATAAHELTQAAIGDADQLLSAFTALLRIARLESGQVERAFEPVDLANLAMDAFELYEAAADEQGVTFTQRLTPGCEVMADRDLLFQAVGNLLDNALKFTPAGGSVTLEVRRRDGQVAVGVADSGPGVPPQQREQIFRRFYRAEPSRSTPGHGLGLSLVAAVARHHDAQLAVFDNAPGLTIELAFSGESER